jgi:hypothetical protein
VAPTPNTLNTAILDMGAAYADAAGRPSPNFSDLGAGEIGGMTLEPGLYKWGTPLGISTDVTLWGSDTAIWIFQVEGALTVANGKQVILAGGALPENIFWQVKSSAILGTTSHVEGIILAGASVTMATGATLNGRAFAVSSVTLDGNTIVEP